MDIAAFPTYFEVDTSINKKHEYKPWEYQSTTHGSNNRYCKDIIDELKMLVKKPSSILDVGCGYGHFLLELAKEIPQLAIHGIERAKELVEVAQKFFTCKHVDAFEYKDYSKFDFVYYFNILYNGNQKLINHIFKHMKRGSYLIQLVCPHLPESDFDKVELSKEYNYISDSNFLIVRKNCG